MSLRGWQRLRETLRPRTRLSAFIRLLQARLILRGKRFDASDPLIICGEPRGGTTWLMELLATLPRTAVHWEPLHPQRGVLPREFRLGWRPFIPEQLPAPEVQRYIRAILNGRRMNAWTMYAASVSDYRNADRLLIKFCYASALLPWLTRWFRFRHKPIHLLRHPMATAHSQVQLFKMHGPMPRIDEPDDRYNDRMREETGYLRTLTSHMQLMVAHWCMANQPTLTHPGRQDRWTTVFYEHLLLDPVMELSRIQQELRIELPTAVMDMVRKGSATVHGDDLKHDPREQLAKWMRRIPVDELDRIQAVLDHYGVTIYHSRDPMPKV